MAKNHSKYYVVAVLPLFGVENGRPDTWKGFLHCQILQIKVYRKIHEDCILTYRLFFLLCKPLKKISELLQHFFFLYLEFLGRSSWRNSSGTFSIFNFYIHVYMFMMRISMFDDLYASQFRKPKTDRGGKTGNFPGWSGMGATARLTACHSKVYLTSCGVWYKSASLVARQALVWSWGCVFDNNHMTCNMKFDKVHCVPGKQWLIILILNTWKSHNIVQSSCYQVFFPLESMGIWF